MLDNAMPSPSTPVAKRKPNSPFFEKPEDKPMSRFPPSNPFSFRCRHVELDDGLLSAAQVRKIKSLVPQGKQRSVRSSLFDQPARQTLNAQR
jgi:hypothetical protein